MSKKKSIEEFTIVYYSNKYYKEILEENFSTLRELKDFIIKEDLMAHDMGKIEEVYRKTYNYDTDTQEYEELDCDVLISNALNIHRLEM